ncbi:MAG TPA: hypothetical protein VFQ45_09920, partial [Longimicrobium sp.]|nr:hypothetical protein [Longimicrobium sp.]
GATPDVVAGVWLGFDRPQRILANASGGGLAAPVWGRVMAQHYTRHTYPAAWTPPGDLVGVRVDRASGRLAGSGCPGEQVVTEHYVPGTEPVEVCPLHPDGLGGWLDRTVQGIGDWLTGKERRREAKDPWSRQP